jgi:ABC-type transport system involved in multi-copper enzyme maturation permease subunit
MTGVDRLLPIAGAAFRGSLRGSRTVALGAIAAVPTLIVVALAAANASSTQISDASLGLFGTLTLRVVMILVVLVIGVAQFRGEIEDDTLAYLTSRSVPRAVVAVGKYLGSVLACLVVLVPSALVPLAVAQAAGGSPIPSSTAFAVLATVILGTLAYDAVFLLFGLVSPSALLLGLIYGFLWEFLLSLLPGTIPRITLVYYLHALLGLSVTSGPLSGYPTVVSLGEAIAAPLGVAVAFVSLTAVLFRYEETAPLRSSA